MVLNQVQDYQKDSFNKKLERLTWKYKYNSGPYLPSTNNK